MAEFKNYDTEEQKLKKADARKMSGEEAAPTVSEMLGGKKTRGAVMAPISVAKKKGLPIVVDIVVGVVMLALVAAIIVGAYLLFKYYSNEQMGVGVEYTVVCSGDDLASFASLSNGELYVDADGSSLFFGKVKSIKQAGNDDQKQFVIKIKLDGVAYKEGEGYLVSGQRLAVGSELALRCGEMTIEGTVVELVNTSKEAK